MVKEPLSLNPPTVLPKSTPLPSATPAAAQIIVLGAPITMLAAFLPILSLLF
jgi:hypothetical protein